MTIRLLAIPAALAFALSAPASAQTPPPPPKAEPHMQKVLDALASLGGKPIETLTPAEARKQPTPADAVKKVLEQEKKSTAPEPVGDMKTMSVTGSGGAFPIHVFTPKGKGPFPVIVYYHGGGWVIADTKTYEASVRSLTNGANAVVVSVDYRQGPEAKFPAAHEDSFAAYKWVVEHAKEISGDPARIAVAGESAGGNLAAAVTMMARDAKIAMPVHQLLVYPIANYAFDTPSYTANAAAKPLNKPMMQWFFKHYLKSEADGANPHVSLLKAGSLKGLPPATVITAQIDPLMSEGKAYADKLKADGVTVSYKNYDGVTHEFFGMGAVVPLAKDAMSMATGNLKKAFAK